VSVISLHPQTGVAYDEGRRLYFDKADLFELLQLTGRSDVVKR
jgi:hypothetical protein